MAKRKETVRAGWSRQARITSARSRSRMPESRRAIAQASGAGIEVRGPGADIRRMGPYEMSYQIDFGYGGRELA